MTSGLSPKKDGESINELSSPWVPLLPDLMPLQSDGKKILNLWTLKTDLLLRGSVALYIPALRVWRQQIHENPTQVVDPLRY